MKLNRDRKTAFLGFKIDPETARVFRQVAKKDGGLSAVLRRLIENYLKRKRAAA